MTPARTTLHRVPHRPMKEGQKMQTSRSGSPSLLQQYTAWKRRQAAEDARAAGNPVLKAVLDEEEREALAKSRKRVAKSLKSGASPTAALFAGHRRYAELGGRATFEEWVRRADDE